MGECNAIYSHHVGHDDPELPGDFLYYISDVSERDDAIGGMIFKCPCGCNHDSLICFVKDPRRPKDPFWTWNGNIDRPTVRPSIKRANGCEWHGFLTNGIFQEA